jgi:AmpD protein
MSTQYWFPKAKIVPSPFYDDRPADTDISLLVVHNISLPPGQFDNDHIESFFQGKLDPNAHPYFARIAQMRVSAHCLIKRDGKIIQFVPFDKRAWHAGVSSFAGVERCNDYSIGIELEGTDTLAYTPEQYGSLSQVTHFLMRRFPLITQQRITGHQYIAPYRKSDPGLIFDWRHFMAMLNATA